MRWILPLLAICGFTILAQAQYDPPGTIMPTGEVLKEIETKTAKLAARIDELRKDKKTHELLPDVEIYLRGAINIVRFKEFYHKDSGKWTLDALDRGLERADQLAKGETPWTKLATRNVLRAYRSVVDGTAQPYGVTYPLEYGKDRKKSWRVDVVLHGRDSRLTEVSFINTHNGKRKPAADQDWVQIDIFGRGNNAYRWAGETDVFGAMDALVDGENKERRNITDLAVVLRGFSMGGAGTWHLGLHYPWRWRVIGPGAGFTSTHDYAWKGKKVLPDYQEKCLRIYDAIDYAENARMVPIVAYSGGDDLQKMAADNIENLLKELKINNMTHLVKPGVGHKFDADYFAKANTLWAKHVAMGQKPLKEISFVTYTTRFPMCDWLFVDFLEKHYERASIDVKQSRSAYAISTKNIQGFTISTSRERPELIHIDVDGQKLEAKPDKQDAFVFLMKKDMKWVTLNYQDYHAMVQRQPRKCWKIQGPIDDAFTRGFVCVKGSGNTWHPATQKYVDAKLAAFKYDWGKHWRGELPTTGDYAVTPNDINEKNLILFGDPSSNLILAQILPKLPLKWTKDEIEFAGKKFKASEHVPVMIFPNPMNPYKYVVLNTGHTWPSEDYAKTNALLYPRLGDYAILRLDGEVATAGLFDEFWRVEKK